MISLSVLLPWDMLYIKLIKHISHFPGPFYIFLHLVALGFEFISQLPDDQLRIASYDDGFDMHFDSHG
jgi:hypothetical protein